MKERKKTTSHLPCIFADVRYSSCVLSYYHVYIYMHMISMYKFNQVSEQSLIKCLLFCCIAKAGSYGWDEPSATRALDFCKKYVLNLCNFFLKVVSLHVGQWMPCVYIPLYKAC